MKNIKNILLINSYFVEKSQAISAKKCVLLHRLNETDIMDMYTKQYTRHKLYLKIMGFSVKSTICVKTYIAIDSLLL